MTISPTKKPKRYGDKRKGNKNWYPGKVAHNIVINEPPKPGKPKKKLRLKDLPDSNSVKIKVKGITDILDRTDYVGLTVGDKPTVMPVTIAKINRELPMKKAAPYLSPKQRIELASELHDSLRVLDDHSTFLLSERTKWLKQVEEAESKLSVVESAIATRLCPFIIGQRIRVSTGPVNNSSAVVVGVTFQTELPYYTVWIRYKEVNGEFESYSDLIKVTNASNLIGCLNVEDTGQVAEEVTRNRIFLEEHELIPSFKLRKVYADEIVHST